MYGTDTMRRTSLWLATLAVLAIGSSSCSSDPSTGEGSASSMSSVPPTQAAPKTEAPSDDCVASFSRVRSNELHDALPTLVACHTLAEWWAGADGAGVTHFLDVKTLGDASGVVVKVCGVATHAVEDSEICQQAYEEWSKLPPPSVVIEQH